MVYDARHRPWRDRSRMPRRAAQRKRRAVYGQVQGKERSQREDLSLDRCGRHPLRETPGDRGRRDVRTLHDVGPPPLRDDEQDIDARALRSEFHESHGRADRAYRRYAVGVPGRLSGPRGFSDRDAGIRDGKSLAVARVVNEESFSIWIKRLDRGPSIKLTLDGKQNYGPAWTPDGRSVTFSSTLATGATDLW